MERSRGGRESRLEREILLVLGRGRRGNFAISRKVSKFARGKIRYSLLKRGSWERSMVCVEVGRWKMIGNDSLSRERR
jgi:hypothetical protein